MFRYTSAILKQSLHQRKVIEMDEELRKYTERQMRAIVEEVWGKGLYSPGGNPFTIPCPECGAGCRVNVEETVGSGRYPQRFGASCSSCGKRGSGRSTEQRRRRLGQEELNRAAEAHTLGQVVNCPECQAAPLGFEELGIRGSSSDTFNVLCCLCGSFGTVHWPPEK